MNDASTVFLDVSLPNATTWFYFSALLAVALFFKFTRLLSIRNLDVATLFLLVPGFLLLLNHGSSWAGYLWILCGSLYFLFRCLLDLALVRRPALVPNLNLPGLAWLALAFFACLVTVAFRPPRESTDVLVAPATPASLDHMQKQGEQLVQERSLDADARFWVERTLALLCHLSIVAGLIVIGCRHFQDAHAGMAAATFYLLLPYTALNMGQWYHVWPMALIVWAVACYRSPIVAGFLLGLAGGTVYFPILAFPVWWSFYYRRGAGRFTAAFLTTVGLCLAGVGLLLWTNGELARSLNQTLSLSDWQPWKEPTSEGFWLGIHWAYRLPVFIAYLAFLLVTSIWPSPKNLAHLLALTTALFIGVQLWYANQGGVYVLWYLPLLLLLVFRPRLSDHRPPEINPEHDWVGRLFRAAGNRISRLLWPDDTLVGSR